MEFFNSAIDVLQTLVIALAAAFVCGAASTFWKATARITPRAKSQGVKQLVAGGGVALIGVTLVPLLSGLLG